MTEYKPGTVVMFKGGLGRNDDRDKLHTGIVNGQTFHHGDGAYVPVHVQRLNHNLVVYSRNIVRAYP